MQNAIHTLPKFTGRENSKVMLDALLDIQRSAIAKFQEQVATGDVCYAICWHAQKAMQAQLVLKEVQWLSREIGSAEVTDSALLIEVEGAMEHIMETLVGCQFGGKRTLGALLHQSDGQRWGYRELNAKRVANQLYRMVARELKRAAE